MFVVFKKVVPLHPKTIGLWCNGNTADSGPAFPGSSPGSPTARRADTCVSARLFYPYPYPFIYYIKTIGEEILSSVLTTDQPAISEVAL